MYCWVCNHRAGYEKEGAGIEFLGRGIDWSLYDGGGQKSEDEDVVMSTDQEQKHELYKEEHDSPTIDRPVLVSRNSLEWLMEKTHRLTLDKPRRVGTGTKKRFCDTYGDEVEDMLKGEGLVDGRPVKKVCGPKAKRKGHRGHRGGRMQTRRKWRRREREMDGMMAGFGIGGF